jgi:histidine triad (HIT) family protein
MVEGMASLFTRIIAGELPAQMVFADPLWVGLLDISPASPGHVLLIPRAEAQHLAELPDATLAALGGYLARATSAVKRATGCPGVNVLVNDGAVAGQAVPHAHLHVIPRFAQDGLLTHPRGTPYGPGEAQRWGDALRTAWA